MIGLYRKGRRHVSHSQFTLDFHGWLDGRFASDMVLPYRKLEKRFLVTAFTQVPMEHPFWRRYVCFRWDDVHCCYAVSVIVIGQGAQEPAGTIRLPISSL